MHPVGDEVLRAIPDLIRRNASEQSLCGSSVVGIPQIGGRIAVSEPIPVSWTRPLNSSSQGDASLGGLVLRPSYPSPFRLAQTRAPVLRAGHRLGSSAVSG